MKNNKPKGKSQEDLSGKGISDPHAPSFQQDEDDVDFEILDALEQIEQAEKDSEEPSSSEGEETPELTLDEEELDFGEEGSDEESGFRFDENLAAGLEEELSEEAEGLDLDESAAYDMGEDVYTQTEEESISLDLNEEDEDDLDLSFDEGPDLEAEAMAMSEESGEISLDLDEDTLETEELTEAGFEQPMEDFPPEDTEFGGDAGIEQENEEMPPDMDLDEFNLNSIESEESFQTDVLDLGEESLEMSSVVDSFETGELSSQEGGDIEPEDTEQMFGEMESDYEIPSMQDDSELETGIEEESIPDMKFSETTFESEPDEFSAKSVISVDGEEVIDLGDETEFDEEEFGADESSWESEEEETDESFDISEEDTDLDLEGMQELVDSAVSSVSEEQEQDEEFMASLEEIEIDLGEETAEVPETSTSDEISEFAAEEPPELDLDNLATTISEEQEIEGQIPLETGEENQEVDIEQAADDVTVPEIDEREELELTLRLADSEVNTFETMVTQAKTLQRYIEELEEHKNEIKEDIYQKLMQEYTSRKADIFAEPEFISMQSDLDQDLQDILAKQTEFASAIERLNEELEEVKVRHLVGEYDDSVLSEREEAQKVEIAQWQEKTEKIQKFITRYQELLETERELNPPQEPEMEEDTEEEVPAETEQEVALPVEETVQEEEPIVSDEEEEETTEEWEEEEIPEEWGLTDEDMEITAEGLTDQEFSEEEDLTTEEFDLEGLAEEATEQFDEEGPVEEEAEQEEMISCKKCGRETSASEKFCVNCGAKAQ